MADGSTARPSDARALNDRNALELLLAHGSLTATQLAGLTGLSRPTITDLVGRLQRVGLVRVGGPAGASHRGPSARLYQLVADRAHVVGIDLRVDHIACTVAELTGRAVTTKRVAIDPGLASPAAVDAALVAFDDTVRQVGIQCPHTVAVGVPGIVNPATRVLERFPTHPKWHTAFIDLLGRRGAAVLTDNDVNLACLAEHRIGSTPDRDTFALMWLGHGTGAAIMFDGRLLRGTSGGAGEVGYLPVPAAVLPSATGSHGGFNSQVCASAICALAGNFDLVDAGWSGSDLATAIDVVRAAGQRAALPGNPPPASAPGGPPLANASAEAFLAELAGRIAVGAAAISAVLDPGCIVLGGEIGAAGGPALAALVHDALIAFSPLRTEVRASTIVDSAVLHGAVLTALRTAQDDVFRTMPG